MSSRRKLRFVSTFAGVGGFDTGFEDEGMECVMQVEIEKHRRNILASHWPHVPRREDVTTTTGSDLPEHEVLAGGFPCQGTSGGAPNRLGLADPRSRNFWEFARLVEEYRPEWFILENPTGFLVSGPKRGWDFWSATNHLVQLGYSLAYRVVDAADCGSAQRRLRVLLVGHRGADPARPASVLADAEGGGAGVGLDHEGRGTGSGLTLVGSAEAGQRVAWRKSRRPRSDSDYATYVEDGLANTLTGFDSGYGVRQTHIISDNDRPRMLTIQEWERLQGFPDDWTAAAPMSHRFKALGDAMNVHMARWLARRLVAVDATIPINA